MPWKGTKDTSLLTLIAEALVETRSVAAAKYSSTSLKSHCSHGLPGVRRVDRIDVNGAPKESQPIGLALADYLSRNKEYRPNDERAGRGSVCQHDAETVLAVQELTIDVFFLLPSWIELSTIIVCWTYPTIKVGISTICCMCIFYGVSKLLRFS